MPYRLSPLAEQEIWSYIAEDASPSTADRLVDALFDRFELLVDQPRMGRIRPEFGEGVRSVGVESYVIYYRTAEEIDVLYTGIAGSDHSGHEDHPAGAGLKASSRNNGSVRASQVRLTTRRQFDRSVRE